MERKSSKKLIILFFLLSTISFFRLFRITVNTSSPTSSTPSNACSSTDPTAADQDSLPVSNMSTASHAGSLTPKEYQFLSRLILRRSPCNLLFFGLKPQFISLSKLNGRGTTIILEDDAEKLRWRAPSGEPHAARIRIVSYPEKASKAYELLKYARTQPACRAAAAPLQESHCKLALTKLPSEIYNINWDVVVVDGPNGDQMEAPGRMGVIYTAAMIARAGHVADVLVHDIDRIIEKWYSWEFLCHENLVSSKGKFWHFRIQGNSSFSRFCSDVNSDSIDAGASP